jgi:hypothetical protein
MENQTITKSLNQSLHPINLVILLNPSSNKHLGGLGIVVHACIQATGQHGQKVSEALSQKQAQQGGAPL